MVASIIITCWNGRKLLEENFPSVLAAAKNPKNKIKEIIVVDDGSTDNSVEYINKIKVRLIAHDKNYGYSKTCNTGVNGAVSDLVAILNLDVVPKDDFLENIFPLFENDKVFSVSFNEGKFGPGKLVWKNGFLEIEGNDDVPKVTTTTDWPSGGSSVFRKNIWESLGGMDDIFLPFYFEDIDLGVRARQAGYQCLWEPNAKVEHKHEATINSENFNQQYINSIKQRNQLLLTWKYINNFKLFSRHIFYLGLRCLSHPGYFRILLLSLKRRFLKM